ncbi:aminoacyl-tRNA deacylase [Candidatus Uabimicrobium amorphum]|uniref:Cys-tRNA(Pro)/Cys-tRNA(Cys) deacylase n=1 Tax=Uabimicrobium amorphum TaxID=2596890 RepID=A0A5S9IIF1_UABAM|nr:aminoacyl-tRNA deacylase [Candidatus Uabimicrobium amorphum]BBM81971.1 Cys-tRNA(Pro)/Cys-tRNA(Cys) deacylase [Candidatus Uabimicrobium amorphum]
MTKKTTTPAIRLLKQKNVTFVSHTYKYEEHGGAKYAAQTLETSAHMVVKTIVMQNDNKQCFIILMHGDKEVSLKKMAREINCKTVKLCHPDKVRKLTNYLVGGTSPFATKTPLKIYCEHTIQNLEYLWINAGKRGLLVKISFQDLQMLLQPQFVNVAIQ